MSYERKIINDPVFGFINIPKGLLYDIVRHPLLQRFKPHQATGLVVCGFIPVHSTRAFNIRWGLSI